MTTTEIAAAREVIAKATPGPWESTDGCAVFADGMNLIADTFASGGDHPGQPAMFMPWSQPQCQRNARFVAYARSALPAALDALEAAPHRSRVCILALEPSPRQR
jgi:hypothetical protein